ncbi:hypothetical protein FRC07_006183 [Ceratobasidium sp. 392]|nr:hypothetical protein FRC07_006183 [Ceratobasidium sp. 392]
MSEATAPEREIRPLPTRRSYYLTPLTGPYEALNVMGKPPLFILKDAWDDKPRPKGRTTERYHQVVDIRTRLQMLLYSNEELSRGSLGMVEWTDRSVEDKDSEGSMDVEQDNPETNQLPRRSLEPGYESDMALLHANIAGWDVEDNEDEEVLSICSSKDEENKETNESSVKIYYPLFPNLGRLSKKGYEKLKTIANCDDTQ